MESSGTVGYARRLSKSRVTIPIVPRNADGMRGPTRGPTRCCQGRYLRGVSHSQGYFGDRKYLVSEGKKRENFSSKFILRLAPPPVT